MRTVYTGGTFDLLHPGHLFLLSQCRAIAGPDGRVIVALNTDDFVFSYKKIVPTHSFEDRRRMLMALRDVDLVVTNTGREDSRIAIDVVRPDVIAIGDDWKGRDYHAQMGFSQEWLDRRYIELIYLPLKAGISSTYIRESLGSQPARPATKASDTLVTR